MPGIPRTPRVRLHKLEVENFKSYRGRQDIGPFYSFTAVIGPNGSGKSNLMDAISFVLGVKGAQLRGSLKELLYTYSDSQRDGDRPQEGRVTLFLELERESNSQDRDEPHFITFTRSITCRGQSCTSSYAINDETVAWAAYEDRLKDFGILVKARNFLVFQGDIEAVAGKQPQELTKLFESISGSEAFKADYDRLEEAQKDAEKNLQFVLSRKKSTAATRKRKKEQKEEADRHMEMQEEMEQKKGTYYLWQLYHAKKGADRAEVELASQRELLETAAKELRAVDSAVKERKKELAGLIKRRSILEQKIKAKRSEVDKKNPDHIKTNMEKERVASRIKALERDVIALQQKEKDREKKVAHLQKQLEDLEAAQREQEAQPRKAQGVLDDTLVDEFHKLSEEAKAKTAKARSDLNTQEAAQQEDRSSLSSKRATLDSLIARREQLEAARVSTGQEREGLQDELKSVKQSLEAKRRQLQEQEAVNRRNKAKRVAKEQIRAKLEEQLRDSRASRKEMERDVQMRETLGEMKRLFQGVYGRVSELGKVTSKGYNVALAVVMGNDLDSVVVEDERVAKECISYLKQKRIPPMTFIPLQTIKASTPNSRLRTLGGTAKLALDLIDYDPKFTRAFIHACGSTLVCEDEDEAKSLAFGGQRLKVVTKAGLLIARSGAMTGGGTGGLANKAARFEEAANQKLRHDLLETERELDEIPTEEEGHRLYRKLQSEILNLENKIPLLEKQLQADQGRLFGSEEELTPLMKKIEELQPEVESLLQAIDARQTKIDTIKGRIHQAEDKIFANLSKKAGVASIREFMESNKEEVNRHQQQRIAHTKQSAKVKQQLEYERKVRKPELREMQGSLKKLKDRLAELDELEHSSREDAEAVQREVSKQVEELDRIKNSIEKIEAELKELKKEEVAKIDEGSKLKRAMTDQKAALEAICATQADILHTAALEQIKLPMREEDDDEDEPMDTNEEIDGAEQERTLTRLDFSSLKRDQKSVSTAEGRNKMEQDFQKDIEALQAELSRVAPNLKASEQFQEAKEKDEKEKAELDEARARQRETAIAFADVKQKRSDAFMRAYDHIKDVIDQLYKDLTKSSQSDLQGANRTGGSAYLSLESTDDDKPFLTGVTFSAVPPTKRWRQMDELSGGEKTVAALALLFAIHSFHPAPFFILDEIDAALDASNVAKVAHFIREKTRAASEMQDFQAVIISLKENFFSKADSLVGVTKDLQCGSSNTFTIDLEQFGEPIDA